MKITYNGEIWVENIILWTMSGFSEISGVQTGRVKECSVETMEAAAHWMFH